MTMEVWLRTVIEALEEEWHARMKLVVALEHQHSDSHGKSFNKPSTLKKLVGSVRSGKKQVFYLREEDEDTKVSKHGSDRRSILENSRCGGQLLTSISGCCFLVGRNGVFLLKFANYISSGLDMHQVKPQNMPFFILKLTIEFIKGCAFV
ncbi:ubiquitin-like-specific protease 1A [Pyrus ussuriensis x Pyrus communis]|uniref:Ubiquitin-like-specific protease 1A n=1 Tax=Pyrus ussuriensis x Pyrus communis TaxID=2448454 RepID=A0A5N5FTS0_9ROSA|nr:ubiquitin-like-specific protease 1A [Pyrus ussuriensis x Pyrus communis]